MHKPSNLKRHILLTCAVCLFWGCQPAEKHPSQQNPSTEQAQDDTAQSSIEEAVEKPIPLLTLDELLQASDVKSALMSASKDKNIAELKTWQERLLAAADEVNLAESERKLLSGEQGLVFLEFQGMKYNYQREFEKAFVEFQPVEPVFEKYPAFTQLQANSRRLIEQRDALIQSMTKQLEEQGVQGDAESEARRQWQQVMLESIN